MSLLDSLRQAEVIGALDQRFAQMLARRAGLSDPWMQLACALASRAPQRGDVGIDLDAAVAELEGLQDAPLVPSADAWIAGLLDETRAIRRAEEARVTPLVLDGRALYLDRYWRHQQRVLAALRQRLDAPPPSLDEAVLRQGLDRLFDPDSPSPEQRQAAEAALRRRFSVIAGGPGTGKTAVVVKLLALANQQARARDERPPRVLLLAPTGKAAARLSASIRATVHTWIPEDLRSHVHDQASTIHRALGVLRDSPRFRHHADSPLPADLVVVDEASMVDLPLMARLLDAIPPHARLVLLGDPDQLVSVEMGSVLGDIVRAAPALGGAVVQLRHSFRYSEAPGIQRLADAIHQGDVDGVLDVLDQASQPEVRRIEPPGAEVDDALRALAVEGYREAVCARQPQPALDAIGRVRVLCAHRRGLRGVNALNRAIEAWLREEGLIELDGPWYLGRPVLVRSNDRQVGLFNGDVGVVLEGEGEDGVREVVFGGGEQGPRRFPPVLLPEHETVFATTVHKAQGSEYDRVVVVLPDEVGPLLTRELLYTAVTRARSEVIVIGSAEVIRAGVARRVERMTGLSAGLTKGCPRPAPPG